MRHSGSATRRGSASGSPQRHRRDRRPARPARRQPHLGPRLRIGQPALAHPGGERLLEVLAGDGRRALHHRLRLSDALRPARGHRRPGGLSSAPGLGHGLVVRSPPALAGAGHPAGRLAQGCGGPWARPTRACRHLRLARPRAEAHRPGRRRGGDAGEPRARPGSGRSRHRLHGRGGGGARHLPAGLLASALADPGRRGVRELRPRRRGGDIARLPWRGVRSGDAHLGILALAGVDLLVLPMAPNAGRCRRRPAEPST